jgi:hypothetical protein
MVCFSLAHDPKSINLHIPEQNGQGGTTGLVEQGWENRGNLTIKINTKKFLKNFKNRNLKKVKRGNNQKKFNGNGNLNPPGRRNF